jgi:acyl carrier protein
MMETELLGIIRDEILESTATLTAESDLFEAGLDSMAIMQLLLHIEDHFDVALEPADLSRENFQTAAKIAALIESKR